MLSPFISLFLLINKFECLFADVTLFVQSLNELLTKKRFFVIAETLHDEFELNLWSSQQIAFPFVRSRQHALSLSQSAWHWKFPLAFSRWDKVSYSCRPETSIAAKKQSLQIYGSQISLQSPHPYTTFWCDCITSARPDEMY